jgi:chemotaxis protein methyltransferase CheR
MPTLTKEDFDYLSGLVRRECGIVLEDGKQYLISSRLAGLMRDNAMDDFTVLCGELKRGSNGQLKEKIVDAMTTNETLWFRDQSPFLTLLEKVLPEKLEELATGKRAQLKIWSAACSTGQEPYSIAMTIQEVINSMGSRGKMIKPGSIQIVATDISESAMRIAKLARYNELAMSRGMLPGYKEKHFIQQGSVWQLKPEIQQMVTFRKYNLQDSFSPLGKFDLIFLRNVAIYFSADFKKELYNKLARSLTPDGLLFIGASESLPNYAEDYDLKQYGKCYYYQTKRGSL